MDIVALLSGAWRSWTRLWTRSKAWITIQWEQKKKQTKMFRKRETELLIHLFIQTYYSGHALPGTNRRADECKHTRTHTDAHHYTQMVGVFFVTVLVCPMLSLHTALKLEVLTPTCLGTGVKMLMLMAGIDAAQCSDPSSGSVRSRLWRAKWRRRGERRLVSQSQGTMRQKKGPSLSPAEGGG